MAGEGQKHCHGYQSERRYEGKVRAVLNQARTKHADRTLYGHDSGTAMFSLLQYQENIT